MRNPMKKGHHGKRNGGNEVVPLNKDSIQTRAVDTTSTFVYPWHEPEEIIHGWDGLMKVVQDILGPNVRGEVYRGAFHCLREGTVMSGNMHHCPVYPKHPVVHSCLKKGHIFYCPEWIEVEGRRVRCSHMWQIESTGCARHPVAEFPMSLLVKSLAEGKIDEIKWEDLNDPAVNKKVLDERAAAVNKNHEIVAENDKIVEENFDADGQLAEETIQFHVQFNENKKAQQTRARTEAADHLKLRAAVDAEYKALRKNTLKTLTKDPKLVQQWRTDKELTIKDRWAEEAATEAPKKQHPRLAELEAKRSGSGLGSKKKGSIMNKIFGKGKRKSGDEENQPPDQP